MSQKTTILTLEVQYDDDTTDPDGIAEGLDILMNTATSTEGILDEYGNPNIDAFYPVENEDMDTCIHDLAKIVSAMALCLNKYDKRQHGINVIASQLLAGATLEILERKE